MENNDSMRNKVFLAALLHDIGKLYQRSDTGTIKSSKKLSSITKNNISAICPNKGQSDYGNIHALWTAQFFEDHQNIFNSVIPETEESIASERLQNLSASHHISPSLTENSRIVQLADYCSAGMDRSQPGLNNDEKLEKPWNEYSNIPLRSLFAGAFGEKNTQHCDYPVIALNTSEWFIPTNQRNIAESYSVVWQQFEAAFMELPISNFEIFADSLHYLLSKFTCNIPSSTVDYPDISLFDHLKTSAAIALCLYDHSKSNQSSNEFLLIGADISGIQSFIYDISSKGASKNLKGRSFYVQVLLQTIATSLIQEMNLQPANIIYNSGGGFYILAPNTPEILESLSRIKNKIEQQIFHEHGSSLYVALSHIDFGSETLLKSTEQNNLGLIWTSLSQELNRQKRQRYLSIISDYDTFFKPSEAGGIFPKDAITGEEFTKEELNNARNPENVSERFTLKKDATSEALKPFTATLINLGRWMKDAEYWVISKEFIKELTGHIEPLSLGVHHYFISHDDAKAFKSKGNGFSNALIINLSTSEKGEIDLNNGKFFGNNIIGFDFYGGNYYPTDRYGDPLTFDELCDGDFKRLGILRMDVDNLGRLFKEGGSVPLSE
ncbi:MAG TPA: type III-A CRISPR-associated protein Cas10/Csm1 [Prolixibacteraceae bacterium]|nr:type III-A CRISPR-associated protein Cas10/Csm1 [Prolixibacteraceae bacterium]